MEVRVEMWRSDSSAVAAASLYICACTCATAAPRTTLSRDIRRGKLGVVWFLLRLWYVVSHGTSPDDFITVARMPIETTISGSTAIIASDSFQPRISALPPSPP